MQPIRKLTEHTPKAAKPRTWVLEYDETYTVHHKQRYVSERACKDALEESKKHKYSWRTSTISNVIIKER